MGATTFLDLKPLKQVRTVAIFFLGLINSLKIVTTCSFFKVCTSELGPCTWLQFLGFLFIYLFFKNLYVLLPLTGVKMVSVYMDLKWYYWK